MLNLLTLVGALALTPAPADTNATAVEAAQPAIATLHLVIVAEGDSAAAVAGATIEFVELGTTVEADAHGKVTVPSATVGTHTIKVTADGYTPWEGTYEVKEDAEVTIRLRAETPAEN